MLNTTLKDYSSGFEAKLAAFLLEYEDNSESFFLTNELTSYNKYYNTLIKISKLIKNDVENGKTMIVLECVKADKLKKINTIAHSEIFKKRLFKVPDSGPPDFLMAGTWPCQYYVDNDKLKKHISSAHAILDYISLKINNIGTNSFTVSKNDSRGNSNAVKQSKIVEDLDENKIWFKVGLLFASGKMEKYYKVNDNGATVFREDYTSPKIAKDLGKEGYNKYILATIQNYPVTNRNADKNIFNSKDRMKKIVDYCKHHKIDVLPYFIGRIPSE